MRSTCFFVFMILLGGLLLSPSRSGENNHTRHSISFAQHQGLSTGRIKPIDKDRLAAIINPTAFAKHTAASSKEKILGFTFAHYITSLNGLVLYSFFKSYLFSSKDFIAFKRILLYPKHSFW